MRRGYGRDNEANLGLLLALYRSLKAVRRREAPVIAEQGLTFARFEVLELLYHKGEQSVSQVIAGTLSSIGNVSVVVENLAQEGLVLRRKSEADRRVTLVALSPAGRKRMRAVFPRHLENVNAMLGHLTPGDKRELTKLLIKLEKSL